MAYTKVEALGKLSRPSLRLLTEAVMTEVPDETEPRADAGLQ